MRYILRGGTGPEFADQCPVHSGRGVVVDAVQSGGGRISYTSHRGSHQGLAIAISKNLLDPVRQLNDPPRSRELPAQRQTALGHLAVALGHLPCKSTTQNGTLVPG